MDQHIAADWYTKTFDALYPVVYAHRSVDAARPEAQFAAEQVSLQPADSALDLCCGNGRHMAHLLKVTGRLVGLDYSADLLRIAAQQVAKSAASDLSDTFDGIHKDSSEPSLAPSRLVRADMRHIPFRNAFDVVVNFFTSFGYFFSPDENRQVVAGVSDALKPGGRFFIDYVNRAYVERTLVPESVRAQEAFEIHERRWLDEATWRVNKKTRVTREGAVVAETDESVRLYTLDEFRQLLETEGLAMDRVYGDYSGAPCDEDHPRMIVVGHKA